MEKIRTVHYLGAMYDVWRLDGHAHTYDWCAYPARTAVAVWQGTRIEADNAMVWQTWPAQS